MAPRNLVEWIAGGNAPIRYPPARIQQAPKKILRVTVSTDSEDSSSDDGGSTTTSTSSEACKCKKVRFQGQPKKSAMKKKADGEEKEKEKPKDDSDADECTYSCRFCRKNSCEGKGNKGKGGNNNNTNSNGDKQSEGSKQKDEPQSNKNNKNNNNVKQPLNTNTSSKSNSNNSYNEKQTQERKIQDTARKNLAEFVRRSMSRLIQPSRSEVMVREDVIESPSDPRPNAFFDSRTGILRVYHGPVYGNPFGTLIPLGSSNVPIGTPGWGAMRGGGSPGAFSSFGPGGFGVAPYMSGGLGDNPMSNDNHSQANKQYRSSGGGDDKGAWGNSKNSGTEQDKSSLKTASGWGDSNDKPKENSGGCGWGDSNNNNDSSKKDSSGDGWRDSGKNNNSSKNDSNGSGRGDSGNSTNDRSKDGGDWSNSNDKPNDNNGDSGWGGSNENNKSTNDNEGWGNSSGGGNASSDNNFASSAAKDAQADGWGNPSAIAWGGDSTNDNNDSNWKKSGDDWGGNSGNNNDSDWGKSHFNDHSNTNNNNSSWDKVTPQGGETALSGGSWADGGTGPTAVGVEDDWGKPFEKASWGDPDAAAGGNGNRGGW